MGNMQGLITQPRNAGEYVHVFNIDIADDVKSVRCMRPFYNVIRGLY